MKEATSSQSEWGGPLLEARSDMVRDVGSVAASPPRRLKVRDLGHDEDGLCTKGLDLQSVVRDRTKVMGPTDKLVSSAFAETIDKVFGNATAG